MRVHLSEDAWVWILAIGLFVTLLAAREAGGFLRVRVFGKPGHSGETSYEGFVLSAVLSLLAFLIGFTFNMALHRYEARRELVIAEANAIGSAYMRFQVLDAQDRGDAPRLLREYADLRLAYGRANQWEKPAIAAQSRRKRAEIEAETETAVLPFRSTALATSLLATTIEVSDLGVEREGINAARIPPRIFIMLAIYMAAAAAMLGHVMAGAAARHRPETTVLLGLFVFATMLILDIDSAQSGGVRVSQNAMEQLVQFFHEPFDEVRKFPSRPPQAATAGVGKPAGKK